MHFTIIEDNCLLCPLVIKKILRCWFRSNCSGSGGILSVDRGPEICIFLVCKYRRYVEGHFSSFPSNMIFFVPNRRCVRGTYLNCLRFLLYFSLLFLFCIWFSSKISSSWDLLPLHLANV